MAQLSTVVGEPETQSKSRASRGEPNFTYRSASPVPPLVLKLQVARAGGTDSV
jgi:hypothetical protein